MTITHSQAERRMKKQGPFSALRKFLLAGTALTGLGLASPDAAAQQVITYDGLQTMFDEIDATTQDTLLQTILGGTEIAIQAGDITTAAPFTITINVMDATDELAITGDMSGDGNFFIIGPGRTFFFGNNSDLTGQISIDGPGTLFAASGNAMGDTVVTFNDPGGIFAGLNDITISTAINLATDGMISTSQAGEVNTTFSGDIDTMGNILSMRAQDNNDTLTVSSNISGAGSVSVIGSGDVRISGNSTYTGGTSLDGDGTTTIVFDDSLGTGTITFNNAAATLEIDNGANVGNALDLATAASLESAFEGIDVAEFSGDIDTMGNALTITANPDDEFTVSGIISGAGAVTVTGGGITTFSGASTFTGGTTVSGTLLVTGSTTGLTTVNNGATLGGTGTIDDLTANGTVTPGTSIGTLSVNNDAAFNTGSIFSVELDGGGGNDLLAVGGQTTIASGATVDAILLPGQFMVGQTFTILTSGGGVTGTFDSITSSLSFIELGLTHNANDIEIEIINIITLATIMDEGTYTAGVATANAATGENAIDFDNGAVINLTGDASAFNLGDGNSMFLLGNNATINGNGFTALQLTSGTLNISNLTINGAVQLDGGTLAIGSDTMIGNLNGAAGSEIDLNDKTLTIDLDADSTYAGIFSGDGTIIKDGTGVLSLKSESSFFGDFSLAGDGGIIAEDDGAFGDSTVFFDNANTSIIIEDGTNIRNEIIMNTDATIRSFPGEIVVEADTPLDANGIPIKQTSDSNSNIDTMGNILTLEAVDADDQLTMRGDISGAGNVIMIGLGDFLMTGPSTYTGGTSLEGEGTTFVGRSEGLGTGTITFNNAMAILGILDLVALDNAIDMATDAAIETLNGAIELGEVNGDINTMGNALAINTLDEEDQLTFGGVISGAGGVTLGGQGLTIFAGSQTYTGGTMINAGTLLVNGSIVGPTTVGVDATLGGTGTVNGTTTIMGTLSPGESIGTLSHVGDATFETGSVFEVEINSDGTSDLFNVTGSLTVNGGTLIVNPETNAFGALPDYIVASASDGVTGAFDETDAVFSFLVPTYEVVGNDVVLSVGLAEIEPFAMTANQTAFAKAFDEALVTEELSDDLIEAFDALYTDLGAAPENIDQLTGEGISTFSALSLEQVNIRNRTLTRHINESRRCYAGYREGASFEPNCDLSGVQSRHGPTLTRFGEVRPQTAFWGNGILWLNGYGGVATGSSAQVGNFHVVGFDVGYDRWVAGSFLLGFSTGYVRTQGNNFGSVARGETEYGHLSMHGSFRLPGGLYSNGILTASFGDMETSRNIEIETLSRTANAHMTGKTVSAFIEVGVDNYFGNVQVQPYGSLQYAYVQRNGFTETGAGDLNLTVGSEKFNSMQATLGVRASTLIKVSKKVTIRPEVRAGYTKEFGDANSTLISKVDLLTLPAATMDIASVTPFQDGITFGASIDVKTSEKFHFILDYDALLSSLYDIHTGTSRVQWLF